MARLWGREFTRRELSERIGDLSQLCGIDRYELSEGLEKGVSVARFRTGSGFSFEVLLDRGMGIGLAEFCGVPLTWISPTGRVAPSFYEPRGFGWLRGFHGGLLVTCGLTQVGTPGNDGDEELGLHGRASYLPAESVATRVAWEGDDVVMTLTGQLRQARVFGENIMLTRRISTKMGESKVRIHDTVENLGFETVPHMILYHLNFGFPVVGPSTRLLIDAERTEARDSDAEPGFASWMHLLEPRAGFREQVFYHTVRPGDDGMALVKLEAGGTGDGGDTGNGGRNEALFGGRFGPVYVKYPVKQLPVLVEWKMMGAGTYVLGLEPANCHVEGRASERVRGTLEVLEPGESREYELEIGVE